MSRHIEASSDEAVSIDELSRNHPGEWVAVRVAEFDSDRPSTGFLLKSSPKGEEVVEAVRNARSQGLEGLSTLRGVKDLSKSEIANALALEEYLEMAEYELRTRANSEAISTFAERIVEHFAGKALSLLSDPEGSYNDLPQTSPLSARGDELILSSMLVAAKGNSKGLICLAAALLTEDVNQKLTILDFVDRLTRGKLGNPKNLPSKKYIVKASQKIRALAEPS